MTNIYTFYIIMQINRTTWPHLIEPRFKKARMTSKLRWSCFFLAMPWWIRVEVCGHVVDIRVVVHKQHMSTYSDVSVGYFHRYSYTIILPCETREKSDYHENYQFSYEPRTYFHEKILSFLQILLLIFTEITKNWKFSPKHLVCNRYDQNTGYN